MNAGLPGSRPIMNRVLRDCRTFVCTLLALGACDLIGDPSAAHPLVGTWEIATVLDSVLFETSSSPDCPGELYCRYWRGAGAASLQGTLTVGDSAIRSTGTIGFPLVSGTFTGRSCAQWDASVANGCASFGGAATITYPRTTGTGLFYVPTTPPENRLFKGTLRANGDFSPSIEFVATQAAGDSITGLVVWRLSVERAPPQYHGTFTARRRR
jgi:hypothetical protein